MSRLEKSQLFLLSIVSTRHLGLPDFKALREADGGNKCQLTSLLCVVAAFLLSSGLARGQVNPGTPSFSSYDSHGIDTVNLQNLDVSLNIPVMSKPGAIPFSYGLSGDSYVYLSAGFGWVPSMQSGLVAEDGLAGLGKTVNPPTVCPDGMTSTQEYTNWYVWLGDGTKHYDTYGYFTDTRGCYATTFTVTVSDGSGYTLVAENNGTGTVYTSGGTTLAGGSITDANSNVISYSGGVATDTLGLPVLTLGSGTAKWTDVNGGSPTLSETNSSLHLKSVFGCPAKTDYDLSGQSMLTSVGFPDGTSLGITYEPTPGNTGDYTGRIHQLTLQTGGTVTYQYSGSNNGLNCTYQLPPVLTRQTSDGTTTYTWAAVNNGSGHWGNTTTVVDNGGNKTIYTFTGLTATGNAASPVTQALTQVQHYQGSSTLLTTDVYCYGGLSGQPGNCATAVVSLPVTEQDIYHTINGMTTSSRTQTKYDNYGNVKYSAQYDFGGTTPVNSITTTYGSCSSGCTGTSATISAIGSNINNKPGGIVTALNGNTVAESRYTYDSHGNLLTTYKWTGASWLSNSTANVYNSNGTISTAYDLANNPTTYGYSSTSYTACGGCTNYPFPTSVSKGGLTTYYTWNGAGGVLLTSSNSNASSTVTTYGYASCSGDTADPFWRVMSVTDPLATNEVCKTYPSSWSPPTASSTYSFNSGQSFQNTTLTTDGYGRTINVQTQQGPLPANYDTVSTEYGWSGNYRTITGTLPCSESLSSHCSFSSGETVTDLDPIGRLHIVTDGGGGTNTVTYSENDVLSVLSPSPSGENIKQVQNQYDGLGRLTSSCAISSTVSGNVSCGQNTNTSAAGVLTSAVYTSGAGYQSVTSTRGSQSRSIIVDGLGRTTQKVTPEGGTWNYYYDSSYSSCPSGYAGATGQLEAVIDPNGNKLCYAYDSLKRVTGVNANGTTCRHFYYDNSSGYSGTIPTGITLSNQYGRMVEAATDTCSSGTLITDEWFAYDKDGNQLDLWQLTPHSTQYYHSHVASFYGNGLPASVALASPSLYTMTYGLDGEGRFNTLTDTTANQNIVTGTTYFPAANPEVVSLTSSDNDAYTYDLNTNEMTKFVFTVGGNNLTGNLHWNANNTLGYLAITDGFNSGGSETCYSNATGSVGSGYDDLGRLVEFDCGSGNWGQQFSYDQYDNLSKTVLSGRTGTTWNPGYSSTTNHCTGCTYDSNGDVTGDGNDVYGWNEFSKVKWTATSGTPTCGSSGRCATYDAFGRMVETSNNSTWNTYWYTQAGGVVMMSGTTVSYAHWPTTHGIAEILGTTNFGYMPKDWIGNTRIVSNVANHTVSADQSYTPYGEIYNIFGANNSQYQVFAGTIAELAGSTTTPIMWDTPNRELSFAGRWLSPDPAGSGWNQYAYPTNPNSQTDPLGLAPPCPVSPDCRYPTGADPSAGCISLDGGGACAQLIGSAFDWLLMPVRVFGCRETCGYFPAGIAGLIADQAANNNLPSAAGSPTSLIRNDYKRYQSCVQEGVLAAGLKGAADFAINGVPGAPGSSGEAPTPLETAHDAQASQMNAMAELMGDCLKESPLAPLNPAYQGPLPSLVF